MGEFQPKNDQQLINFERKKNSSKVNFILKDNRLKGSTGGSDSIIKIQGNNHSSIAHRQI